MCDDLIPNMNNGKELSDYRQPYSRFPSLPLHISVGTHHRLRSHVLMAVDVVQIPSPGVWDMMGAVLRSADIPTAARMYVHELETTCR